MLILIRVEDIERESISPQAFITAGMEEIVYRYSEKWKAVAEEYYEKKKHSEREDILRKLRK